MAEPGIIYTFTHTRFNLADPRPEDVKLLDVARGLGCAPRYAGQGRLFYSVAEHSLILADLWHLTHGGRISGLKCAELECVERRLQALVHDAAKAYIGDITAPMKLLLDGEITELEDLILKAVRQRWHIGPIDRRVKELDKSMRGVEKAFLFGRDIPPTSMPFTLEGWLPDHATLRWASEFHRLLGLRRSLNRGESDLSCL